MLTEIYILYKRSILVYAAHIALLDGKVVLEVGYVPNHENVFQSGGTAPRVLNCITR